MLIWKYKIILPQVLFSIPGLVLRITIKHLWRNSATLKITLLKSLLLPVVTAKLKYFEVRVQNLWNVSTGGVKSFDHGLINYLDTKTKCRHLKILTCKGFCRQVFIRVYRPGDTSSHVEFLTQLCDVAPLTFSLAKHPPPPIPVWISKCTYTVTLCNGGGGGWGGAI
jgi:hypothetical protein